ncbi:unnamed protein product [Onchocerca ochengi]|uniref:Uncharacterized protein n=1 Tax=Onchocerca ochengi TaxID=42157 RepID=A0A182EJP7_ONCOC|nr:unnamed protein product [Onchocerca ochengi]
MSPSTGHYLLLFLTICLMTSGGHCLSHRYHSNHQYQQQQQEEYHFLPTRSVLIPAASRLQLPPNQHAIIRRDSPPQQQYSPPGKIHSTTPTVTLVKKIDMSQIEEELKALKKKRKRLRQLRGEIRELSDYFLNSKQVFSKDDANGNDLLKNHKMKETYARWRKQITSRVKSIMRRLKKLENEVKTERNFTKERRKLAKRLPMLALNFHTVPPSSQTLLITTNKNLKIRRLHSSINQSKNGESGAICIGHNDCKPGLCCHRTLLMNANSSISSTANSCYQYMLKEGELCEDSCQCEARLHCFRSSNQLNTDKSIAKSQRNVV